MSNKDQRKFEKFFTTYKKAPLLENKDYIAIYKAVADDVRHSIYVKIIKHPGITGKEIGADYECSQPTISFHINELIKAKLIVAKKVGLSRHYYLNNKTFTAVHKTIISQHVNLNDDLGKMYQYKPNLLWKSLPSKK